MRANVREVINTLDPVFIFRDEFTGELAAGSVNGTKSSDGKEARTVVDTENKLSITGGKLVIAGGKASPAYGDPGLWYGAQTRTSGLALFIRHSQSLATKYMKYGFDTNQSGGLAVNDFLFNGGGAISIGNNITVLGAYSPSTEYIVAIVLTTTGTYSFIKGGAYSNWTLLYKLDNDATATLYPSAIGYDATINSAFVRLAQLPAPFTDDYGIATQRLAGARSAGDTFTHEANCKIEWTVTTAANTAELKFRMQDTTNFWSIRTEADGDVMLYESVGGELTSRGYVASSIANGQIMVVIADGTTIKVYANNVLKITYTSATNFATATSGKLHALGTGGAISDIVSYPRTLAPHLQSMLNRYTR